jgi:NAD(P)-dependent dehydrogenase (short-subunit alcohol dehydrogenase family)
MTAEMGNSDQRLAGRRILITGAASGIGRATAELFAAKGAKLALVDANAQGVNEVASALGAHGIAFDLTDVEHVGGMVEQAAASMGGLDGVVNCAGLGTAKPLVEMDLVFFRKVSAINFEAPIMICKAALPFMQAAGGGTIVNIASGQGILPNAPNNTAYCATKGGLIAFSKNLAVEGATYGVRVNAVAPGVTNTPMASFTFKDYANPSDAPFVQQYALKRVADPIEIANAILFLTSDESSYVTGSALAVDGGRCFH